MIESFAVLFDCDIQVVEMRGIGGPEFGIVDSDFHFVVANDCGGAFESERFCLSFDGATVGVFGVDFQVQLFVVDVGSDRNRFDVCLCDGLDPDGLPYSCY